MIKVSWSKRALKQLGTIDTRYRKRIKEKVGELSTFPDVNLDLKNSSRLASNIGYGLGLPHYL